MAINRKELLDILTPALNELFGNEYDKSVETIYMQGSIEINDRDLVEVKDEDETNG